MTEWQDIETAPKECSRWILGAIIESDGAVEAFVVTWDGGDEYHDIPPAWVDIHENEFMPTHWMPLPAPPEATDD